MIPEKIHWLAVAALLLTPVRAVEAGTITGTVHAQGKAGTAKELVCGNYESRQYKFVERINYDEMKDFVVYIDGPMTLPSGPRPPVQVTTTRVEQKGAIFSPHVLPVLVGTTVEWPNNDEILHNVFSFSEPKQFDLGLYKAPQVERVTFDQPGRVDVFCSIHARMSCIILVLQNPYFATTNKKGVYRLENVPAGHYKLKAWHERLPVASREIVVPETGEVRADFTLGILNLPKP